MRKEKGAFSPYCSEECLLDQKSKFGEEFLNPSSEKPHAERNAQLLKGLCGDHKTISPILTAKFLSRMIFEESNGKVEHVSDYSLWDHVDRLHYIDLEVWILL